MAYNVLLQNCIQQFTTRIQQFTIAHHVEFNQGVVHAAADRATFLSLSGTTNYPYLHASWDVCVAVFWCSLAMIAVFLVRLVKVTGRGWVIQTINHFTRHLMAPPML